MAVECSYNGALKNYSDTYKIYVITGECKEYMKKYMNCLKKNNNDNHKCRTESKDYLQCRMDRYPVGNLLIVQGYQYK